MLQSLDPGTVPAESAAPTPFTPESGVSAEMVGRALRFESRLYRPTDSYADIACDKVWRAHESLGLVGECRASILVLIRELTHPWGALPVGTPPERACWVSIDGMPFEPSIAWVDGEATVRLALEPPGAGTPQSRMEEGMAFTRRLADRPGVSIERYLRIEDLFTTEQPQGYFSLAHAVAWRPGSHPLYKIFLNPAVCGREQAAARTEEAMIRLGLERPWRALAEHLGGLDDPAHEPASLALDLIGADEFRVQLYLAHSDVSPDSIDAKSAVARDHIPGSFARALRQINGQQASSGGKPPVTCFTLDSGQDLPGATLYIPLIPVHDNDAAARDRVAAFLRDEGADPSPYVSVLDSLADRPLTESATQNFISYRGGDAPRFAVYLAPGTYRPA
ncbi:tryptophan dimethylallyltransferase family protein [Streptomyces sp. H27-D2]|uniref:tryptophan dimethylallyltransferase family protein n=1 Tax=Streptomyces sp. H27-D2 TaxID=3046304 RepID=UPI002DBC2868|nr:tryptophan dimethylallyltransferase family protein [Streptomyces sp. H27-D2]MEC4019296.1 tryptophan dimethylallyltransferase family protein [Streptomyces sp. H27-D2]